MKDCPFCGSSRTSVEGDYTRDDNGFCRTRYVVCWGCGARGPFAEISGFHGDDQDIVAVGALPNRALALWRGRVSTVEA